MILLSEYEFDQVKRLLAGGFSPNKVARMVGVDIKAVYRVAERGEAVAVD